MKRAIVRRTGTTPTFSDEVPAILQRVYANRGLVTDDELDLDLSHLLGPGDLLGIDRAVRLLADAMAARDRILIVGDFDADGATSTALAVSALQAMGADPVDYLVPNRFEFGYGLSPEIVEAARELRPDLIVTVDNGISSVDGVAHAKADGCAVVITDHHLPPSKLPDADATVNPNQPQCGFPSKHIAGVGVAFYLMAALRTSLREAGWFDRLGIGVPVMADFLDLVALGTIADLVPLDRNNRILVKGGMRRIRAGRCRPGIKALVEVAGATLERMTSSDLGFALAPRLNAAGRLEDMSIGIACLLAEDADTAGALARQLDDLNRERREIEKEMREQADAFIADSPDVRDDLPYGLCLYHESWHQGIVGILAARVKDNVHRPTIAFAKASADDDDLKGSGRSIEGFHMRDALERIASRHPDIMSRFGGHAMAAGLTIRRADLARFRALFNQDVQSALADEALRGAIRTDGSFDEPLSLEAARMIEEGGPWGQGFEEPLFDDIFEVRYQKIVGSGHLKMRLARPGSASVVDAIAFNRDAHWRDRRARVLYRLDVNYYRGTESLQLVVEDLYHCD